MKPNVRPAVRTLHRWSDYGSFIAQRWKLRVSEDRDLCWIDQRGRGSRQGVANRRRDRLQSRSLRQRAEVRPVAQPEPVVGEARDHVQVRMEHFLPRHFAVCEEEIDALALHATAAQRRGHSLSDFEHSPAGDCIKFRQVRRVLNRNDEQVPRVDRPDVHEGADQFVAVDDAGRSTAGDDVTEDAGCGFHRWSFECSHADTLAMTGPRIEGCQRRR